MQLTLRTGLRWLAASFAALALLSCGPKRRGTTQYDRGQLDAALAGSGDAALLIGEFALAPGAVVDGDTIKVEGLDASLRLLGIDTEETFKSEKDLRAYESLGFEGYLEKKAGDSERPVKCATPVGMDAKHFAEDFFRGVTTIRLERDHPKELRGLYSRVLAYIFVERSGEWINYNIEAVRAGMSPYFSKYGYSRRFHDEFVAAQEEARAAERGIWDPKLEHYRDYDVRLKWWDGRGDFVRRFERDAEGRSDLITLTHWDALDRLAASEGKEIELLAGVGSIKRGTGRTPTRVELTRRLFSGFPIIFFDDSVVERSRIEVAAGEFVRVRGTVTAYTYKSKRKRREGERQLQIVVRSPAQIVISETAPSLSAPFPTGDAAEGLGDGARLRDDPPPEPEVNPEPELQPESQPEPQAEPTDPETADDGTSVVPPPPPPPA